MKPVLIMGIGNILLRDEGIGVHVIDAMRPLSLPDQVELLDGGTSGADLVDEIADRDRVIVVDAVNAGYPAGTVLRMGLKDLEEEANGTVSLHEFGLLDTMNMAQALGCAPREVVIFAVQVEDITTGLDLSQTLSRRVPGLVQLVLAAAEGCTSITDARPLARRDTPVETKRTPSRPDAPAVWATGEPVLGGPRGARGGLSLHHVPLEEVVS